MLSSLLNTCNCWRYLIQRRSGSQPQTDPQHLGKDSQEDYTPDPKYYPVFPPPPPQELLDTKDEYWTRICQRKYGAPQGILQDSPLLALYRFYEFVLLDKVFDYRNALEAFWRQSQWAVADIPDPTDDNHERYAFLAGCTYLLARSFNARIKLGLQRQMPSLFTEDEAVEAMSVPDHLRPYEHVPEWATKVLPLEAELVIPTADGTRLDSEADERADPDFLLKNILIWTPHVHFT